MEETTDKTENTDAPENTKGEEEDTPSDDEQPENKEETKQPEAEPEPENKPEPENVPEPEPAPVSTKRENKKKRIQVDLNASLNDTAENSHYLSALPVVPETPAPYTPIMYTFRVKAKGRTKKVKHATTKPPPFYLQFDHAIAVIWTLFNKEANKENLGIVQLQWGLHFLESIYNNNGVHPKDVQLCINTIQDSLIDKYAQMSEEPVVYAHAKLGDFIQDETDKCFSVNYSEMIKKCPQSCALDSKDSTAFLDRQLLEELEHVKKVVGIESVDLTKVVSKDQVMNILNDWRKEQLDKIQDELKMLYVVEDMMKNSDTERFDGYTDEKQFKTMFKKNT